MRRATSGANQSALSRLAIVTLLSFKGLENSLSVKFVESSPQKELRLTHFPPRNRDAKSARTTGANNEDTDGTNLP
jgi:hypothetical protein